jgi:hypothetical protein
VAPRWQLPQYRHEDPGVGGDEQAALPPTGNQQTCPTPQPPPPTPRPTLRAQPHPTRSAPPRQSVVDIDWGDIKEAIPAFLTMAIMPLTYSVAYGVIAGLVAHIVIQVRPSGLPQATRGQAAPACLRPCARAWRLGLPRGNGPWAAHRSRAPEPGALPATACCPPPRS